MKLTNLSSVLFLVTSACGAVIDPSDDPGTPPGGPTFDEPPLTADFDEPTPPPPATLPLMVEAPRSALTERSLFDTSFVRGRFEDVIQASGSVDIVEQRITTLNASEVEVTIELAPPTGTFARTLVSDIYRNGGTFTDQVLCESNGFATYDPRCETATPAPREMPSDGALTSGVWSLRLLTENNLVSGVQCESHAPNTLTCVLPPQAGARYKIVASASGFTDLWDGSSTFAQYQGLGIPFFGGWNPDEWQCWDWRVSGSSTWCAARYQFVRFTAVDRARLEFDPITLKLSAGGASAQMATPALSWDAGNDDVPGALY